MTDTQKIELLRDAVIGLLGQVEEHAEDIGPCCHLKGICRCRAKARMREARIALKKTKPKSNHEPQTA